MPIQDDQALRDLLSSARTIAVIGYSDNPERESYLVGRYLKEAGYTVHPVNPTVAEIDGQKSYPSLADVPGPIDIVNVFRRADALPGIVDEAIAAGAKVVWAQEGIASDEADRKAEAAGLPLVMDCCIRKTHERLML